MKYRLIAFVIMILGALTITLALATPFSTIDLPDSFVLTLGNRDCELVHFEVGNLGNGNIGSPSSLYTIPDSCIDIRARLRSEAGETLWIGIHHPQEDKWLKITALSNDDHPPKFDKRGRFAGCSFADKGYHTCDFLVTYAGQSHHIAIPVRVGVLDETLPRPPIVRPAPVKTENNAPVESPVDLIDKGTQEVVALDTGGLEHSITIPAIGLVSGITTLPLSPRGTWDIEQYESQVGHLQGTSWVGKGGNIVLGGHSVYPNGNAGIFGGLDNMAIGHEIAIQDAGLIEHYTVSQIQIVDQGDISVANPNLPNQLTLITCYIPSFDGVDTYTQRLVVIATKVE